MKAQIGRAYMKIAFWSLTILLLSLTVQGLARASVSSQPTLRREPTMSILPVHNLNTSLSYYTIQEAIDAMATLDGHVIKVDSGVFYEHVSVYKRLTLIGNSSANTIIDGNGTGTAVSVTAINVTITGFNIRNASYGISTVDGANIRRNNVTAHGTAMYLQGPRIRVIENNISRNSRGIYLYQGDNLTIIRENNVTANNSNGIELYKSDGSEIAENNVANNYIGIELDRSPNVQVIANNIVDNNWQGIRIISDYSKGCNITGNTIVDNGRSGIESVSGSLYISNNNISRNNFGVYLWNAWGSRVFHNYFNNTQQAYVYGSGVASWNQTYSANLADFSKNGNFWSDYTGHDMYSGPNQDQPDSDGIGDTPYKINDLNWDYLPLMKWIPPNKTGTSARFFLDPNPAICTQTVTLLGNLTNTDNNPIPGAPVTVKLNDTAFAILRTNSSGWFKASGRVGSAGTFNITVEYGGSMQYLPSSDWQIMVVNKAESRIYFFFVPNPVNSGETCMLEGIMVDQFSNPIRFAIVTVEYSTDYGSTWNPAGTLTTNFYGVFSKTFTAPSPGTYLVRISYAGSANYGSSTADIPLIVR